MLLVFNPWNWNACIINASCSWVIIWILMFRRSKSRMLQSLAFHLLPLYPAFYFSTCKKSLQCFTPNFTFNLLMNSYFILVFPVVSDSLHSFLHLSAWAWSVSWIIPTSPLGFSYSFILTHSLHLCSLFSVLSIYRRRFFLFPAHAEVIVSVQMMWWKGISGNKGSTYSRSTNFFSTLTSSAPELLLAGVIKACPQTFSLCLPAEKTAA